MGKSIITLVNLLSEGIELNNIESFGQIEIIVKDLMYNHKLIDDLCFDLIKTYKLNKEHSKKIFFFIKCAFIFERIGELCNNLYLNINKIISFPNLLKILYPLSIVSKDMISLSIDSIISKTVISESIKYIEIVNNIINFDFKTESIEILSDLVYLTLYFEKICILSNELINNNIAV